MRTFSFRFFFPLFLTSLQFVGSFLFSPRHLIVIHTFPHVVQEQAAARKAACSSNVTVSRAARPRPPSFGNWGIVSPEGSWVLSPPHSSTALTPLQLEDFNILRVVHVVFIFVAPSVPSVCCRSRNLGPATDTATLPTATVRE